MIQLPSLVWLIPGMAGLLLWILPGGSVRQLSLARLAAMLQLAAALALFRATSSGDILVEAFGDWQAPFGIVLAVDRLSSLFALLLAVRTPPGAMTAPS